MPFHRNILKLVRERVCFILVNISIVHHCTLCKTRILQSFMHKQEINDLLVFHRTYYLLKRIYRLNAIQKSGTSIDVEL